MMVPGTVSWDAPSNFIEAWRPGTGTAGVFPKQPGFLRWMQMVIVAISYVKIWCIIQLKQQQVSVYMEIKDHIKKSPLELLMN